MGMYMTSLITTIQFGRYKYPNPPIFIMNALNDLSRLHNAVLKANLSDLPKEKKDDINRRFGKVLDFILEETSISKINKLVVTEYKKVYGK